jgi:ELWxxDGT repeat protein
MKKLVLLFSAFLFISITQSQVTLLSNNTNLERGFVMNGKAILLAANDSIWITDGTPAGTNKLVNNVKDADTGFAILNNVAYFTGVTTAAGAELWKTDGTAAGTVMVKDIIAGANSSAPTDYTPFNNKVYFIANDGTNGAELWITDGTAGGTTMVKDINPGPNSSMPFGPSFTIVNNTLFFVANNGTNGAELWKSDGSAAGTVLVKDISAGAASTTYTQFNQLGNTLIFGRTTGASSQYELWRSDGTNAGTTLIKNFGDFSGFFPPMFYLFNNKLYFTGTDFATTGTELWVTDGTTAGTSLVKDIEPGTDGSMPFLLLAFTANNKFYFSATTTATGNELWVSDGTPAGTMLLIDINPGPNSSDPFIMKPFDFVNGFSDVLYNGKVFMTAADATHGTELWITDGTAAGTTMVKDIFPGIDSSMEEFNFYFYSTSGLYFVARNGSSGYEPWLSNGTSAGTNMVADVNAGAGSSDPLYMFVYNDQLYFNANNGDNTVINTDLYRTNGTVIPLPVSLLQFTATNLTTGIELQWNTSAQVKSSYFEVERSADGRTFSNIGKVYSHANGIGDQTYTLLDKDAILQKVPVLYYRLKMVDKDGRFTYSMVVKVNLKNNKFDITIAPNPAKDFTTVMIAGIQQGKTIIEIIDGSGRLVRQLTTAMNVSVLQQTINIKDLSPGNYALRVINGSNTQVKSFIKQ